MKLGSDRLRALGAPEQFIRRTLPTENTIEQAIYVAAHTRIAVERGAVIHLVTGAWHMRRATWLLHRAMGRPPDAVISVEEEVGVDEEREARKFKDLALLERMLKRRRLKS